MSQNELKIARIKELSLLQNQTKTDADTGARGITHSVITIQPNMVNIHLPADQKNSQDAEDILTVTEPMAQPVTGKMIRKIIVVTDLVKKKRTESDQNVLIADDLAIGKTSPSVLIDVGLAAKKKRKIKRSQPAIFLQQSNLRIVEIVLLRVWTMNVNVADAIVETEIERNKKNTIEKRKNAEQLKEKQQSRPKKPSELKKPERLRKRHKKLRIHCKGKKPNQFYYHPLQSDQDHEEKVLQSRTRSLPMKVMASDPDF